MDHPMKRDTHVPAGQSRLSRWERDGGHPPLGGVPRPDTSTAAEALVGLAGRVRRLAPSHRDPEAFHEEKSAIEAELKALARVLPAENVYGQTRREGFLEGDRFRPKIRGLRKT